MFANVLVLFAGLPVILGLTLDTPTNVTSGLVSNVTWTATDGDPTFTLELNHPSFSSSLALANNVNPTSGSPLSIEWPIVPADAVNISNINSVFSSSASFSIAQAPTTGVSATVSTTFTTGLSSSGASASTSAGTTGNTGHFLSEPNLQVEPTDQLSGFRTEVKRYRLSCRSSIIWWYFVRSSEVDFIPIFG
ncbi:hypothetical protein LENED_012094 [Lentinula edodes]|uniref:Uncharacterized protein n=1 Tax=Lentinula edodes TaxID=5353 RepID=A0A1Q3ERT3_LENED|nr:hypothetical protein LENED_012094 [Lentinula edodes]